MTQEQENTEQERDYEAEARAQGWVPEEEFKGANPPKEFLDAKTFVERGTEINGYLKTKLARLEEQLEETRRASGEFREFTQKQLNRERKERENLIKELESRRAQAIQDSDGDEFTRVDKELTDLRQEQQADLSPKHDPLVEKFLAENSWYSTNPKLAGYADGIAEKVVAEGYREQAYYNELARRVKETFPEEFSTPSTPHVESGQESKASSPGSKSYEALPPEAKEQCDIFIRTIPNFTKEQYVATYDWD